ncbi:hypothetical protein Tdes44962_MAKER09757 [Teratosphaeria destructans]|uniref:Uncharacterized protein n=1 Tax=Teratosphaeria destructans TaxID=418781 RepID=A0A9W7W1Y1_9PEZI|nr:hypothetical protein Tdes44962_MAKER09757 [Teratosphaeria destructans]
MWTALLAPFSAEHRARHQQDLVDRYYANLTRGKPPPSPRDEVWPRDYMGSGWEASTDADPFVHADSLRSLFRSDLRDALKRQGLQTQLERTFDEYAITDESGRKGMLYPRCRQTLAHRPPRHQDRRADRTQSGPENNSETYYYPIISATTNR